jgi:hypothetical protein
MMIEEWRIGRDQEGNTPGLTYPRICPEGMRTTTEQIGETDEL